MIIFGIDIRVYFPCFFIPFIGFGLFFTDHTNCTIFYSCGQAFSKLYKKVFNLGT